MGTTVTTFNPVPTNLPYTSPFNVQDSWASVIPRSELIFSIVSGAVAVEAGGDDQKLCVNANLPASNAYVLTDCSAGIFGADFADWDAAAELNLKDHQSSGSAAWRYNFEFVANGNTHSSSTNGGKLYQLNKPLTKVFLARPGATDAALRFCIMNLTVDGSAMTFDFFARFLVFELNQALLWTVNTPTPIR